MAIKEINKGDTILTKDGRKFVVESLRYLGGNLYKLEGVDRESPTPMRTTVWANEFQRVVKKAPKVYDHDLRRELELQADGTTYKPVERRVYDDPNYKVLLKIRFDRRAVSITKGLVK